jgi:hypothetical protein
VADNQLSVTLISQYSKRLFGAAPSHGSVDGSDGVNLYLRGFVGVVARHIDGPLTSASQVVARPLVHSRFQPPPAVRAGR